MKIVNRLNKKYWLDKKIIITGGTGFLGKTFVSALEFLGCRDYTIITRNKALKGSRYVHCDLSQMAEVEAIKGRLSESQFIFFFATEFPPSSSKDINFDAFINNLLMIKNVSRVTSNSLIKLVLASSTDVYGSGDTGLIDENNKVELTNYYSLSKFAQERILEDILRGEEKKKLILRFTSIYGKNEPAIKFIPVLLECIKNNEEFILYGDGLEKRDFINVEDASLLALILTQGNSSGIFNVSTGKGITLKEVITIAEKVSGRKAVLRQSRRIKKKTNLAFGNEKLVNEIGQFKYKTLEVGIREQYRALIEDGN